MTDETDGRIIDAALALAARQGWARLTLAEIAAEAGLTLADLYRRIPSKHAILCRLTDRVNRAALAALPEPGGRETPRERLFEVLMSRLDALAPYKPGLKAIARDVALDPAAGGLIALLLPPSMAWMLEAAGIRLAGPAAPLKVLALTGLYLRVLRVWLSDDSEDGGKTMAELDRLLRHAEGWAKSFERG